MDQTYGDRGVTIAVGQPALGAEGDADGGHRNQDATLIGANRFSDRCEQIHREADECLPEGGRQGLGKRAQSPSPSGWAVERRRIA
jgi:hypothetical protein